MTDRDIRVVLFDLGGVLLELRDRHQTFEPDREADWDRMWIHSAAVRDFERGRIPADVFAGRIVRELSLPYSAAEFLERFDSWPKAVFDGAEELLARIPDRYTRALLSNTNALHWENSGAADRLGGYLDRIFLSFEMGVVKPDDEAYVHVWRACRCEPAEILFLDDNPVNVDAANALGLQGRLVRGLEQAAAVLRDERIVGDNR